MQSHAGTRTRSVETVRPVRWLVGQTRGVAIPGLAPPSVLSAATGSTVLVHAEDGPVRVRVLGAKVALPRAERSKARLAVRALMLAEARRVALRDWLAGAEQAAVDTALCRADDMPLTGRSQLLAALAGTAPAAVAASRGPGARRYSMIAWVVLDIVPCQIVRPMTSSFHGYVTWTCTRSCASQSVPSGATLLSRPVTKILSLVGS